LPVLVLRRWLLRYSLDEIEPHLGRLLALRDHNTYVSLSRRDPEARYWGGRVEERSLVPLGEARLGHIGLDEWLRRSPARA
jgi:hypothetical protein